MADTKCSFLPDVQHLASKFSNSVRSNGVKGFRTAAQDVMLEDAAELLADLAVERYLKLKDSIVHILEVNLPPRTCCPDSIRFIQCAQIVSQLVSGTDR
jgi:hypothetical protein